MRIPMAVIVGVALLVPAPGAAATRGECEASLKRLEEAEPDVKGRFRRKFSQQRGKAIEAQKKEDWNACAASAAEALTPGRPERPQPAR
jgi:hypothetical protein